MVERNVADAKSLHIDIGGVSKNPEETGVQQTANSSFCSSAREVDPYQVVHGSHESGGRDQIALIYPQVQVQPPELEFLVILLNKICQDLQMLVNFP